MRATVSAESYRSATARNYPGWPALLWERKRSLCAPNYDAEVALQEKSYNPYYTLICQHLCQDSHSYKITLQYWLWDFLRDLGQVNVGGAEVIKNLKENHGQLEVKSISSSRMKNVAKAYGWWIAKDTCSLLILKVR